MWLSLPAAMLHVCLPSNKGSLWSCAQKQALTVEVLWELKVATLIVSTLTSHGKTQVIFSRSCSATATYVTFASVYIHRVTLTLRNWLCPKYLLRTLCDLSVLQGCPTNVTQNLVCQRDPLWMGRPAGKCRARGVTWGYTDPSLGTSQLEGEEITLFEVPFHLFKQVSVYEVMALKLRAHSH